MSMPSSSITLTVSGVGIIPSKAAMPQDETEISLLWLSIFLKKSSAIIERQLLPVQTISIDFMFLKFIITNTQ
jgi:hypothetical protein